MTQMQMTSLYAFDTAKKDLGRKQQEVYMAFEEHGPCTNRQLAEIMNWPINTITPRCGELRAKYKIVECYKADDNGRTAIYWGTPQHKADLRAEWPDVA